MHTLPYQNYIFDLYGTLVDIHTDEDQPAAWAALARFYSYYGARYAPDELRAAYLAEVGRQTAGREGLRRDSHEAHPEIELAGVFQALFQAKGAPADKTLAVHAGQFFRAMTTGYLRLYDGVPEMLAMLRTKGGRLYLLSNAQGHLHRPRDAGAGPCGRLRRGLPLVGLRLQKAGPALFPPAAGRAAPGPRPQHHGGQRPRLRRRRGQGRRPGRALRPLEPLPPPARCPRPLSSCPKWTSPRMGAILAGEVQPA